MKFERCFDSEVVKMLSLSDGYEKAKLMGITIQVYWPYTAFDVLSVSFPRGRKMAGIPRSVWSLLSHKNTEIRQRSCL